MSKNYVVINIINRIKLPDYTKREELINSISHGIAFVFSVLGLILLILKAKNVGSLLLISSVIFGIAMVLLYLVSAIYHYPYLNNLSLKNFSEYLITAMFFISHRNYYASSIIRNWW